MWSQKVEWDIWQDLLSTKTCWLAVILSLSLSSLSTQSPFGVLPKIDVTNQPAITWVIQLALCGYWQIINILPILLNFLIIKRFIRNGPHQAGYIFSSSSRNLCLLPRPVVFKMFIASWYQLAPSMTINFIQYGFLWITIWYFSRSCALQSFSLFFILILIQLAV